MVTRNLVLCRGCCVHWRRLRFFGHWLGDGGHRWLRLLGLLLLLLLLFLLLLESLLFPHALSIHNPRWEALNLMSDLHRLAALFRKDLRKLLDVAIDVQP